MKTKIKVIAIKDLEKNEIISIKWINDIYTEVYFCFENSKKETCIVNCEAKDVNWALYAKNFDKYFESKIIEKEIEINDF